MILIISLKLCAERITQANEKCPFVLSVCLYNNLNTNRKIQGGEIHAIPAIALSQRTP